jgi:hypothetical protein
VACCQGEKAVKRVLTEEEYEKVEAEHKEQLRIDREIAEKKKKIQADFRKFEGNWKYWTRNILADGDLAIFFYMIFTTFAFFFIIACTAEYYFLTFQLEASIRRVCVLLFGVSILVLFILGGVYFCRRRRSLIERYLANLKARFFEINPRAVMYIDDLT